MLYVKKTYFYITLTTSANNTKEKRRMDPQFLNKIITKNKAIKQEI